MSSILLFLLLSQTAPAQDYVGKIPNAPGPQQRAYSIDQKPANNPGYHALFAGTCFTMRSYVFARQDGNAPVLVGASTCTPVSTLRMEKSRNRKGELILLDAPIGDKQR
jgi:hypothetical protein